MRVILSGCYLLLFLCMSTTQNVAPLSNNFYSSLKNFSGFITYTAAALTAPVHPLIPNTEMKHLRPCEDYMNVDVEFEASLACSNREIFNKPPYNTTLRPKHPQCFVITSDSPDVYSAKIYNFITLDIFMLERIVGFFEKDNETIYIVENTDASAVYRHELQHYFLYLQTRDGNGAHDHPIWDKCEAPYYVPSQAAIDKSNGVSH